MISSVPATLLVLVLWACLAAILIGVGTAICSATRQVERSRSETFWIGLAALLVYGNLWNLLRPIDAWFWILPVLAGAAGWWIRRARPSFGGVEGLVLLFALWTAGHALAPVSSPDAGLYHVQSVRWYAAAQVVPGLANLNPYLGLNQAFLLLPAAFGVGPFADRGWHLANGLLMVAAMPLPIRALLRLIRRSSAHLAADLITLMLAAPLVDGVLLSHLSGPTADVAVVAMSCYLFARVVQRPGNAWWVSGLLYAAFFSLKMTCVGAGVAIVLLELRWKTRHDLREGMRAAMVGAVALLPWLAHGIVVSGYLIYPVGFLRLPVDWAVPAAQAQKLSDWAWAFARWPGHSLAEVQTSAWQLEWLDAQIFEFRTFGIPVGVGLLCLLAVAMAARWRPPSRESLARVGAVALGLLVWWFTLPDLRFAGVLLWAFAGIGLGAVAELLPSRAAWFVGVTAVLVFGGLLGPERKLRWENQIPALPAQECTPAHLASGESACERLGTGPCFDLMCAIAPARAIEARRPGDPSAGFRPVPGP